MIDELEKLKNDIHGSKIIAFTVDQSRLTADCFLVQVRGLVACTNCEYRNTEDCGGRDIIRRIAAGEFPPRGIGEPIK